MNTASKSLSRSNSVYKIDKLNFYLIVFSALVAYLFPYETFVLAYLVVGPIHYLTESQWLKHKGFFVNTQRWGLTLAAFALGIVLFNQLENLEILTGEQRAFFDRWSNSFIYLALSGSAILVMLPKKQPKYLIAAAVSAVALMLFLNQLTGYHLLIGIWVPTIIHVYLFTLLFMSFGWKKNPSKTGMINIVLLAISPLIIFLPMGQLIDKSEFFNQLFINTGFERLNIEIAGWFGFTADGTFDRNATYAVRIQSFLAFIYLYHYLNWFSKTSVIQWHRAIRQKSAVTILLVWLMIMILYPVDFETGLMIAILLSYLHVFLEFPLNIVTIRSLLIRK